MNNYIPILPRTDLYSLHNVPPGSAQHRFSVCCCTDSSGNFSFYFNHGLTPRFAASYTPPPLAAVSPALHVLLGLHP